MESERPNRSDVHLSAEEAAKAEAATRGYFDEAAPKRHTKPQRSEYSSSAYTDALSSNDNQLIPEHLHFQQLENEDTQELVYRGNKPSEEFTETEYYKDLNDVDKQHHHTTGSGYIKVKERGGFRLEPDSAPECHASSKGNPATNDWIPATDDTEDSITGKPNRSG